MRRCDNMKKKMILLLFIIGIIFIPSYKVEAKTLRQLQNELNKLERDYNANKEKKNMTQSEINALNSQINEITASIDSAKNEIKKSEQEIINNQNEIDAKSKETDELLKFLQVTSGENVYLEYIFESESYTDFIYRYSVVSQLTQHNNELMEELKRLNNELEQKKKELATKQAELEVKSNELSSKRVTLRLNLSKVEEEGSTIEEDIRDYRKEIDYYKKLGCSLDQDVSSCVNIRYTTGWSYPLSYMTVSDDYTGYARQRPNIGGYHHGIDLWHPGISGAPINPVANGTIARIGWISGGGNAIYIYHNVKGVEYTSVYMHMSSFGSGMYQGREVTVNDVIGYVGNTGESFGAHLHLGVAYGHHATNFNAYAFDPRSILYFPQMDSGVYVYR